MARCLPYMRPEICKDCGAAAAASVIGPSVGSIKLQSERSDREQKKKEKKREKYRKEKSEGPHEKSQQMQYQSKKRKHDEMGQLNDKDDHHSKTSNHAMEPFEKSGLTEENWLSSLTPNPEQKKKKEKKREKDRKENPLHEKSQQMQYQSKTRKHDEMGQLNDKDHHPKTSNHAMEPFEKSGLTEENGLSSLTPNPGDFSDSSQDSTKRKKLTDPSFSHKNGCVFRLKVSRKHKDELPPRCEQPCVLQTQPLQNHSDLLLQSIRESSTTSTDETCVSGRVAEACLLQRHQKQDEQNQEQILPSNEHHLFSDVILEQTHEVARSHSRSEKNRSKSKGKKIQLRESTPDWNLPPLQYEDENMDDQGWLFQTRAKWAPSSDNCYRTSIADVQDHKSGMTSLQPQGQYLPQFNICALPFVVPF